MRNIRPGNWPRDNREASAGARKFRAALGTGGIGSYQVSRALRYSCMKSIANVLFILFVSTAPLLAHVVVWFENPSGFTPNSPMEVDYPGDGELILVQPVIGEPCTVEVNMDTPASSLVKVEVISANP